MLKSEAKNHEVLKTPTEALLEAWSLRAASGLDNRNDQDHEETYLQWIDRLAKEKEQSFLLWKEVGFSDVTDDQLYNFGYKDFLVVERLHGRIQIRVDSKSLERDLVENLNSDLGDLLIDRLVAVGLETLSFNAEAYLIGWINGVMDVWSDLRERLPDYSPDCYCSEDEEVASSSDKDDDFIKKAIDAALV